MRDELRFDERVAVITGAGRGIGRAHALLLASRGARVVVNDYGGGPDGEAPSEDPAAQVVAEIAAAGGEAAADRHSVATKEGAEGIVATALERFGRIDIVVNNAGITRAAWPDVLSVHLEGTFRVTQAAWPHLREQGYGRIVNTTSGAGLFGYWADENDHGPLDQYAYGAAKMGIVGFTKNVAHDGARYGIHVNAVAPVAYTRLTQRLSERRFVDWLERHCPPEEVSPAVAFLAHEDCPLNAEILSVGGGRVARVFVAEVPGLVRPTLTAEDVRDHLEEVVSEEGYAPLRTSMAEMGLFIRALKGVSADDEDRGPAGLTPRPRPDRP